MIKSFKKLLELRQDVVLIIAGTTFDESTKYENRLKRMAATISSERIIFTGRYSKIGEIIKNFDVFVYLSKSENLGGVFESLLFEVPTVSSNRGALPELVVNNETGYTVNIEDIEDIVEKINYMIIGYGYEMTKTGKNKVLKTCNKEDILNRSYNIYKEIINK